MADDYDPLEGISPDGTCSMVQLLQKQLVLNTVALDGSSNKQSSVADSTTTYWTLAGITLVMVLPLLVRRLGGLPAANAMMASQKDSAPPLVLLVFTGGVCTLVLANITAILTTVQHQTVSITASGYVIASEVVGALAGLLVFMQFSISSLKAAYSLSLFTTIVGNSLYAWCCLRTGTAGLAVSRMVTGLGAGAMYNTSMVMVHFARGASKTSYMVLYQFFNAIGILLGPVLASSSSPFVDVFFGTDTAGAQDAMASCVIAVLAAVLWAGVIALLPSDGREFEKQAGIDSDELAPAAGLPIAEASDDKHDSTNGAALMITLVGSAMMRISQRLLWESGSVIAVQGAFGWSSTQAGFMYIVVVVFQALVQFAFSRNISGKYPDESLLRTLEFMQLLGIILMFQPFSMPYWLSVIKFFLASIIAYSSNTLWAGVLSSFCVKRAVNDSFFGAENLMLFNQAAIFIGIAFGSIISRAVQDLDPGLNSLAATLLGGGLLQLFMSVVAISHVSLDYIIPPLSVIVGVTVAVGALVVRLGGQPLNVFAWHIVCMGLAWPCFAMLGYWSYKADAFESWEKSDRRTVHMVNMLFAGLFFVAGYYCIFAAHSENGEGHVGGLELKHGQLTLARGIGRFTHVVIGYLVLIGALFQIPLGLWKRRMMLRDGVRVVTWHGKFGSALLLGSLIAVEVGTWINWNGVGGFPTWMKVGLTACLSGLAVIVGM
eukprot:TRINITY_DN11073_c0_g1_i2.p1 TRINITY_DN11073_c0_g1~~TRINITY_DN11073_c0_g1_i2.p1  ORF type:complete len:716 (-),score=112.89 TRINITY_DN11073_c0_g1_i2:197-2344(-)